MNALGYLRVMFTVEDLDDTLARLRKRGAQLVGEVVRYEDAYRLCYIRGARRAVEQALEALGRGEIDEVHDGLCALLNALRAEPKS